MRNCLLGIIALLCFLTASTQNTIGIPNIVNYSKSIYQAGSQNWNIAQDKKGIMYFANNDGLLSFDGTFWRVYPLPNKTIVRSVAISDDNKIYVGGQKEIGYFSPGDNGELVYTSLNQLIDTKDNDFADVWNIGFLDNKVFFRATRKIFEYDGKKIVAYSSPNWAFLGSVSGEILAYEDKQGLLKYSNGTWVPKIKYGRFPKQIMFLRTALPIGKDSILLVTLVDGLFVLHQDTLSPLITPDLKNIAPKNIGAACLLSPDRIALITNISGCIIISKEGKFIQHFTKLEGVQNNNMRAGFLDRDRNLWLGMDNGIDLVTYSNSIKNIFPDPEGRNTGYTATIYNNDLYLGVSNGVYRIRINAVNGDISYTNGTFEPIQNSDGQVWSLTDINGKLMMGHNKGGFVIEGNRAVPIDSRIGYWGFQPLSLENNNTFIAGTYNGINFYKNTEGFHPDTSMNFEAARFLAIGKDIIWGAHPYKGVFSITFNAAGKPVVTPYKDTRGILSSNHNKIFKLKDRIILATDNGIFEYDDSRRDFFKADWLLKLVGNDPVSYLKEDVYGNIWFIRDRKVGVVDRSASAPKIFFIPEIDDRIVAAGFENINIIDSNNVLIAAEKGFFHINYSQYKKNRQQIHAFVRKVQSSSDRDNGLIYGGYNPLSYEPSIEHKFNALHFESSSTLYGQEQNTEYSYYLAGFDDSWSAWTKKRERDYTNLPAGHYTFKVKCRNNFDNESPVASFSFTILPPWYQTWWAYLIYIIAGFGILYLLYKYQQKKYKKQQQRKLQEQQRKYDEEQKQLQMQHQLEIQESEKQIVELRNEKLQAEIQHKNSELASSTMNLLRKKEMLSKLREDLVHYKETPEADKSTKEFQKIVKVIDKELDQAEEWEQFAIHFDSVHSNFLKKLKDQFPDLTVSDLKMAAYLRLNLSSKEIAQLLNISIRGVETSRYRLRKKLGLANEDNLFDHLIKVTS